ncbi:hypothetical protein Gorai_024289 [Gossypium raimondii]|uniref:LOB domain-containing protein n=1 Tax=Gossypium raimondii TaxID=29730 RepID=A0A7J8NZ19_GOSRA|nr:hypothetical protein [Gossypium raimondii]
MTLKGGATSACAACKYQRRKCIPECLLAPYFPADQTKVFQNAHKLFGVSNIVKILRSLDPSQHAEAMRSIKYQANVRDRFPVYGCLGVIRQLYYQIQMLEEEMHTVLTQLEMYRQHHHHQQQQQQHQHQHQISSMADDVISQLELGMAPSNNALPLFNQVTHQPYTMQNTYSSSDIDSPPKDNVENNSLWIQHLFFDTNNHGTSNNDSPIAIQSQLLVPNSEPLADTQHQVVQDYDEIHPFFDSIDDRQSYIDTKDAEDSSRAKCSSEESLKETTQLMVGNVGSKDLKSAAACFSLTSVS